MKKLLVNLLALVLCISIQACNPDKTAYESLENFTERLEQKNADWSEADWDDAFQNYSEIVQTLERYNYSDEQLESIGRLEGKCMAIFLRHGFETASEKASSALREVSGALEGFLEALGGSME